MKYFVKWRLVFFLTALWLLLNDTLAPEHFLLGALLAIMVKLLTASVRPLHMQLRKPLTMAALLWTVLKDIGHSNLAVARIILSDRQRRSHGGLMTIPLTLRNPYGLAVLACIITATPGTVWAGLSEDGANLTLHVLDLQDEQIWIDTIKLHYERPLLEIFE